MLIVLHALHDLTLLIVLEGHNPGTARAFHSDAR